MATDYAALDKRTLPYDSDAISRLVQRQLGDLDALCFASGHGIITRYTHPTGRTFKSGSRISKPVSVAS